MTDRFRQRIRRERYHAILVAALAVLTEQGYDGFRVEEVAQRVGVAKGTIYLDFTSKDKLLDATVIYGAEVLMHEVSETLAEVTDPTQRLRTAVRAAAETLDERRDLAVLMERRPLHGAVDGDPPCARFARFLRRLVSAALRQRGLPGSDSEVVTEALLGLLSRPAWRHAAARDGIDQALDRARLDQLLVPS